MWIVQTIGCVLFLAAGLLRADDFGDVFPDNAAHVALDVAEWCEVDGHRFTFEKTPLSEVISTLGGGRLQRTGDAGAANFDYYVDYTDGVNLIRFSSNNDMGGEDHALQGVTITPLRVGTHGSGLPRMKPPIQFPFGSSAISLVALTHEFGHSPEVNGIRGYIFISKKPGKDSVGNATIFETDSNLEIRVRNGKIVAMDVGRVTSG